MKFFTFLLEKINSDFFFKSLKVKIQSIETLGKEISESRSIKYTNSKNESHIKTIKEKSIKIYTSIGGHSRIENL